MGAECGTEGAAGKHGAGPLALPRETVNFVRRSGRMGLEWGTVAWSGSPDQRGAAWKNTSTEGSLPQKCFREVQPRSFWMAGDPRTQGPGAGNLPAANLQWKNGVGSDPALRPRPPSADCFEEVGPRTPDCDWRMGARPLRGTFIGHPLFWKCGSAGTRTPNCDWRSARMSGVCGTDHYLFGFE